MGEILSFPDGGDVHRHAETNLPGVELEEPAYLAMMHAAQRAAFQNNALPDGDDEKEAKVLRFPRYGESSSAPQSALPDGPDGPDGPDAA